MTEMTWKALSHALTLQGNEIQEKASKIDLLTRELKVLQDYERELMRLVAFYRPRTPEEARESAAETIYKSMDVPGKPPWVAGGRTELQELARTAADTALESIRRQFGTI